MTHIRPRLGALLLGVFSVISVHTGLVYSTAGSGVRLSGGYAVELIVLREADPALDTGECELVTVRKAQHIRGIQDGQVYTTRFPYSDTGEKVSLIGRDEDSIWQAAITECGAGFVEKCRDTSISVQDAPQSVLAAARASSVDSCHAGEQAPLLEIEPLIQSGDPSNRVDLVFFSDGCKLVADSCAC